MSDQDLTPEGTDNEATASSATPDESVSPADITAPSASPKDTEIEPQVIESEPKSESGTEPELETQPETEPEPAASQPAASPAKKSGAVTKTKKPKRARKFTVGQVLSTIVVLALAAGLGLYGSRVSLPIPEVMAMGTNVSVDAASAALICPTPVANALQAGDQASQELSNAGNNKTEDGSISGTDPQDTADQNTDTEDSGQDQADQDTETTPVDDFDADQGATRNTVQTALIGGGGAVNFLDLGVPADTQNSQETDETAELQELEPVAALDPSAQNTLSSFNHGLAISTHGRALTDPANEQFTAATQSSATGQGDARGIAAATCGTAATEHWLVGGGTSLGTSSKLVVQNPGLTPATVTLTVWGPGGRVPLAGLETLLVPAGKQVSVFLEGIAPEQRRTAVHVASTGSLVSAYLQVNVLDGITAKGIDYVTSGAAPGRVQVMTGVALTDSQDTDAEPSVVRIVSPDFTDIVNLSEETEETAGALDAPVIGTASISLLGPQGKFALFGADQVDLVSGAVTDVELTGVPAGNYTVLIEADVPVIAGVRVSVVGQKDPERPLFGTPQDFAWVAASDVLGGPRTRSAQEPKDQQVAGLDEDEGAAVIEPRSASAAVATISGLESKLVLTALPKVTTTADMTAALANIPSVYASDSQAESELETPQEKALREAWVADQRVNVITYSEAGVVLEERAVKLAIGQTLEVDLASFGGDQVRAILVQPQNEAVVDWAVATTSPDLNGALSVLRPVTAEDEPMEVRVTRALSVGMN